MSRKGIQLCYPFEEKRLSKWTAPFIIQPKLDGDRCRAIIDSDGKCLLLSSEENEFISVPHINRAIESLGLRSIELDGELYIHGAPHSDIHGIVSRTENIHPDSSLMEFHIFDLVSHLPQVDRLSQLWETIPSLTYSPIQKVPIMLANDVDDIMRCLDKYMNLGYEGLVAREASAPYVRKRSTSMMKFKPRKEDIYEIMGWQEEISIEGIPKESLGSIICASDGGMDWIGAWNPRKPLPSGYFSVGSGSLLTRNAREELWKIRYSFPGKYARVKYQHMTSARGVPRFPVVVEILNALE
jgi:ATP-dependent DNA ligase